MSADPRLRVLYLKQRFDPEPAPLRGAAFTAAMRRHGLDFTVLTGFPYYPHTSVYDGYGQRRLVIDEVQGTPVHRSASIVGHSSHPLRRLASYVTLPAMATVNALLQRVKADLVLTTLGPAVYSHFALVLARRLGVPCVLEIQDLWPESLIASGMWPERAPVAPVHGLMRLAYRHADAITCLSDGARQAVIERGADPETTVTMLNWAPDVVVSGADTQRAAELLGDWNARPFLAYAGALGPLQGVDLMCEGALSVGARLLVIGDGREAQRLRDRVERLDTDDEERIRFVGQQPPAVTRALLQMSASTVVYLAQSVLDESAIPSKISANLLAGVPMVVAANGETRRLAERINAGPRCLPGDPALLAAAFKEVLDPKAGQRPTWIENARSFGDRFADPDVGQTRYAEFLRCVAERRPIRSSDDVDQAAT